jgi:4-hydroxy-3-polyprenylbenzoate decarboxylase
VTATRSARPAARRVVVGISGGDGVDYAVRLLERLAETGVETHVVLSQAAEAALGPATADVRRLATQRYDRDNQAARIASGSFLTQAMVVAPCDADTVRGILLGLASDLVLRAADVTLKESRRLVLGVPPSTVPPELALRVAAIPGLALVPLAGDEDDAVTALLDQLAG